MKECYCNHCGTKNQRNNKKCAKCHQKLYEHDHVLIDYLLDQTVDEIKGNTKGKIFDSIKYFLKKYLYGIIISITVVSGIVTNAVVRYDKNVVYEKPIFEALTKKKYESANSLLEDFGEFLKNEDIDAISSLMFENNFPTEKIVNAWNDNLLIQNISLFNKNNFNFYSSSYLINGRDDFNNYEDVFGDLINSNYDLYFGSSALVYSYNGEEVIFFDFLYAIIKKDDNYYIANIKYDNEMERFNIYKECNGDLKEVYDYYHK